MNVPRPWSLSPTGPPWIVAARIFAVLAALMLCSPPGLRAQESKDQVLVDKQTLQTLLDRVDQLEARVKQLEVEKQHANVIALASPSTTSSAATHSAPTVTTPSATQAGAPASSFTNSSSPVPTPTSTASQEPESQQPENVMAERMDMSKTLLRIRGFGDVNFAGDTYHGDTTTFALGQLDLFVSSDISDKFKFLSEIVFEGGTTSIYGQPRPGENNLGVDLERYIIQYSHNDYLNISAGRMHTAIGYYNTAYHHSTWLQTTTGRPLLYRFEDEGGPLPIHIVGVSASGDIPSGSLRLHYVAEVGNGRESRTPYISEPVQNIVDENNHKAVNFAVYARPEAIRGMQTGFSVYRDVLEPVNSPRVGQTILAAHAVLVRSNYEWLNEALLIRESLMGQNKTFNTPGFYTQFSKQFGAWRPYFRYQYVNVAKNNPVFPDIGLQHGPSVGVRYDASEFVALKLQYDYTYQRQQAAINALALQICFTF